MTTITHLTIIAMLAISSCCKQPRAGISVIPLAVPVIDHSESREHHLVRRLISDTAQYLLAEYVGVASIRLMRSSLSRISTERVKVAVRSSKWGELASSHFEPRRWIVMVGVRGQMIGALCGSDGQYRVYLGVAQDESGVIHLTEPIAPFILNSDHQVLARIRQPKNSRFPVRICLQGIIFQKDPFLN